MSSPRPLRNASATPAARYRQPPAREPRAEIVGMMIKAVAVGLLIAFASIVVERALQSSRPLTSTEAAARTAREQSVWYAGCNGPRAAGLTPIYAGQPGYRLEMDGDGDGVACE